MTCTHARGSSRTIRKSHTGNGGWTERRDGSIPSATVSERQKEKRDYLSRSVSGFSDFELKAKQERFGTVVLPGKRSRHDCGENLSGIFEEMGDRDGDEILQAVLRIRRDEGA